MSTVRLFHATTKANLPSIQAHGLLVSKADTAAKIKGVWLHGWVVPGLSFTLFISTKPNLTMLLF